MNQSNGMLTASESYKGTGHECERKTRCDDLSRESFECVEAADFRGVTNPSILSPVSDTRIRTLHP